MARFYDPTSGAVRLDGVDLRDLTDTDLRRAVVMVTQENFMFSGSVADNIASGVRRLAGRRSRSGAAVGAITSSPSCRRATTRMSPSGASGCPRTAAAGGVHAAFLADPAVLILDEATSSLDVPSERLVQQGLQTILADRTAVIIAHRLSTVEIADRVLVLEHGEVIEQGSPAELVGRRGGRYAALHRAWASRSPDSYRH